MSATSLPPRHPHRHSADPRRPLAVLSVLGLTVAGLSGVVVAMAPAAQAATGDPQAGTVVFTEGFGTASAATQLSAYTGPGGATYTSDPAWSPSAGGCNGWVMTSGSSVPTQDAGCAAAWPGLKAMASALGTAQGLDASTNAVLAEGGPQAAGTMLSLAPSTTPVLGHFYEVTAWLAAQGCDDASQDPNVTLSLVVDQDYDLATVDPCTAPGSTTSGATTVVRVQSAPVQVTADGSLMGVSLSNATAGGDPLAIDAVSIVDVTPSLSASFSPAPTGGTETSTLTLTITNTDDLQAKKGWSLQLNLPDGLTVPDGTSVTTTCTGQTMFDAPTVYAHGTVSGASCSISIPVVADVPSGQSQTFSVAAGDFAAAYGLVLPTASTQLVVDEEAPAAPVVTAPTAGERTNDNTPLIAGTGENGSSVHVSIDGTLMCTVTVGSDGTWTCPDGPALADGEHTLAASQTDEEDNESAPSQLTFTVDALAPNAPAITAPTPDQIIEEASPAISGTGIAGAQVSVSEGTTTLCTATVAADHTWTCQAQLPDGEHTISAIQTVDGHDSNPVTVLFDVSTTNPDPPSVRKPAANSVALTGNVSFSGLGAKNNTVTVREGQTTLCTAAVTATGTWQCATTVTLDPGDHTITATQADLAGRVSDPTSVTFTVAAVPLAAPTISRPADDELVTDSTPVFTGTGQTGATVTVRAGDGTTLCTAAVDGTGAWTCEATSALGQGSQTVSATQANAASGSSPGVSVTFTVDSIKPGPVEIVTPDANALVNSATPSLTGTGEMGDTVHVTEDGVPVCTAVVDETDTWSCTATATLSDGSHTFDVVQADAAGLRSDPVSVTFVISTTPPDAPVITVPASGALTNDTTPGIGGTGVAGDTVTVQRDGGAVVCAAVVGETGTWSCTPKDALDDGTYALTATQTDVLGRDSSPSDAVRVTVDSTAPIAPSIATPTNGAVVTTASPVIGGSGETGATVTVTEVSRTRAATAEVCTAPVIAGAWTCTPDAPLADGVHAIQAVQRDAAGNVSSASAPVQFTVDAVPPSAPVVSTPIGGATTADATPVISGTGEAGARVSVTDGAGAAVCAAVVDEDGAWSCVPDAGLPEGEQTLSVAQVDTAGIGSPTTTVTFSVDTATPVAALSVTPLSAGTTTTPTISGVGQAGFKVSVREGTTPVCGATVGADGAWSCVPTAALSAGTHALSIVQVDLAGSPSDPVMLTVTVNAPDATAPGTTAPGTTTQPSQTTPSQTTPSPTSPSKTTTTGQSSVAQNQVPTAASQSAPTGGSVAPAPPWAWCVTTMLAGLMLLLAALQRRVRQHSLT